MKLFDAHNHLQDDRLSPDRGLVMERAATAGVSRMAVCGTTERDWPAVRELARAHPEVIPCYGLHPWWIQDRGPGWRDRLLAFLREDASGVGEVGLDHVLKERDDQDQEDVLLEHLELSRQLRRPVVIHCRRAWDRLHALLRDAGPHPVGYLLHAYSGGAERVDALAALNAWFSFGGSLTYPGNRRGPRALKSVPVERLLLETDAPDLAPDGFKRCEPAHLRHVLNAAAGHLELEPEELAQLSDRNARRLFAGIPP